MSGPEPIDCIIEFKKIVKNVITPPFKAAGFEKKGLNFYRRTNDIIQTFWVNKHKYASSDQLSFQLEVGLLSEDIFNEFCDFEMPKIPQVVFSTLRLCGGDISENCQMNHTISIFREENTEHLAKQVEDEINRYFIPFFQKYNSTATWGELLDLGPHKIMVVPAIQYLGIYLKLGRTEQATAWLQKTYAFQLNEYTKTLEYNKSRLKGKHLGKSLKIWKDAIDETERLALKYNIRLPDK